MSLGELYFGYPGFEGLLVPYDRTFQKKFIYLKRDERTADGTLVTDIIARKLQFVITWETLNESEIWDLEGNYNTDADLSLIEYWDETHYNEYTVRMQPFDITRFLLIGSEWGNGIWSNVTLVLDEV